MVLKPPIFLISGKSPHEDSGGYPAYAHTLASLCAELGHPVYTLAVGPKSLVEKTAYGELHVLAIPFLRFFPILRTLALAGLPVYSILFSQYLRRLLKLRRYTSFILWGLGPWTLPGYLLKRFPISGRRFRVISSYFTSTRHEMKGAFDAIRVTDYGLVPKIRYWIVSEVVARIFQIFEQRALEVTDIVVVHYRSSEAITKRYFHVPKEKIRIFPWYTEIFQRHGPNHKLGNLSHPLVVSISRQDPRKGINFIIRAIEKVAPKIPSLRCYIIGTGSFFSNNQRLVKKLGLERVIHMPGFVADIEPILKIADIAVIVPLAQGSSALTVYEAMSYGKAVIGSNCDGIPEDLSHNISGIVVPKGNITELAAAIEMLATNEKLRKRLGANALRIAQSKYSRSNMKRAVSQILKEIKF